MADQSLSIIRALLETKTLMKRWQDPPIKVRDDVPRPYYYIRPYIPEPGSAGLVRKARRISLGFCDETTKRQAEAKKQEIMAPINAGKFILQAQIRFADLAEKYREARMANLPSPEMTTSTRVGLGSATRAKYETHLKNHILPVFGRAMLADIDKQTIEAWLNREAAPHEHKPYGPVVATKEDEPKKYEGLGSWALRDLRNILSAIFTAAKDWGLWQGENPCEGVRLPPLRPKRKKQIPEADDLRRFLAALKDTVIMTGDAARLFVLTVLVAGLRVSEVLGLAPEDVNTRLKTLQVSQRWHRGDLGPPKSLASERVREVGPLADQLAELGRGKQYIFEREPGLPPDDRDLQQHVFRPAAEAVGIYHEGFGMHDFRRLNVTWRQEEGATPLEAMKHAGHSKVDMTFLYTITERKRERQVVDRIWYRIMGPEDEGGKVQ